MVTTPAFQFPVTPFGNPLKVAPVAPVVKYPMFDIAELTQTVCASEPIAELSVIVFDGVTLIVKVIVGPVHPPLVAFTDIVAVCGVSTFPTDIEPIDPAPVAAIPKVVLVLDQLKVVAPSGLEKLIAVRVAPLQRVTSLT